VVAGRMDGSDPVDLAGALEQVRQLLDFCASHLRHENDFIHPALERARPGSSSQIALEHVAHERDIVAMAALVEAVELAPPGQRAVAAQRLYSELALFVAHNFEHMAYEEREHNAVLQAHYAGAEIAALERALVASIPPPELATILRWMLPALNHDERTALLADMRAGAPAAVFEGVLALARAHLRPSEWDKLEQALELQPQPAAA
jgi:hypothetical protein